MKQQKSFFIVGTCLLLLFVTVSFITFHRSKDVMEEGYLASEGNAAQNFAVLAAANIHLTDKQVADLKACSYKELLDSEENKNLRKMMSNSSFATKVDYAYIMIHLKPDEVKYSITEDMKDRFDAPVGTKLDIMWLLDVNVSEEEAEDQFDADGGEFQRYSYYIEDDAVIFGEAPTYIFNSSEWGDHICGYAPIYTVEGNYIGVIGVELQTGDYKAYSERAALAMEIVLIVSLVMLSLLFAYIYLMFRKRQFERIYKDSLTQIYNRSYYNNQFTKRMNLRRSGAWFAIVIADVDWFKKVNDTFGHEIGDEVLIEIGKIWIDIFGTESAVRFGGEEFVAGLWINDESELTEKLELLYEQIRTHKFTSRDIELTISLGASYYKCSEVNGWLLSGMLRAADFRLYEAKGKGRNQYFIENYDEKKEYRKDINTAG